MESPRMRIRGLLGLKPEMSIIIPFYNAEKYILRCLESVVLWTVTPYEIICVNDGSTDQSLSIVQRFRLTHPQVKLISYKKNQGLYHARIVGIIKAKGKYIGFLDSDDYVSKGYFDSLYKSAITSKADISVGQIINVNEYGIAYLQTRCAEFPYLNNASLKKVDSIYDLFWQQQGRCYHWHVVWNKLYKNSIIKQQVAVLSRQKKHLVMMEDFVFSTIILSGVKTYAVDTSAKYYYIEHPSSAIRQNTYQAAEKAIEDMKTAFEFVETYIVDNSNFRKYISDYNEWKRLYGYIWSNKINKMMISVEEKEKLIINLCDFFDGQFFDCKIDNQYYYELSEEVQKYS